VALGGEQRAVAAHRPADDRPRLEAEAVAQERQEVRNQHAHAVLAVCPRVPVALAAVDGGDGETQAGRRDEVDGVEHVHHPSASLPRPGRHTAAAPPACPGGRPTA
jgi:hypothetical protein